jgi:hypothetical protein
LQCSIVSIQMDQSISLHAFVLAIVFSDIIFFYCNKLKWLAFKFTVTSGPGHPNRRTQKKNSLPCSAFTTLLAFHTPLPPCCPSSPFRLHRAIHLHCSICPPRPLHCSTDLAILHDGCSSKQVRVQLRVMPPHRRVARTIATPASSTLSLTFTQRRAPQMTSLHRPSSKVKLR